MSFLSRCFTTLALLLMTPLAFAASEIREELSTVAKVQKQNQVNLGTLLTSPIPGSAKVIVLRSDYNGDGREDQFMIVEAASTCDTNGCLSTLRLSIQPWPELPDMERPGNNSGFFLTPIGQTRIEATNKHHFKANRTTLLELGTLSDGTHEQELSLRVDRLTPLSDTHYPLMQAGAACSFVHGKKTYAETDFSNLFVILADTPFIFQQAPDSDRFLPNKRYSSTVQFSDEDTLKLSSLGDVQISMRLTQQCAD